MSVRIVIMAILLFIHFFVIINNKDGCNHNKTNYSFISSSSFLFDKKLVLVKNSNKIVITH